MRNFSKLLLLFVAAISVGGCGGGGTTVPSGPTTVNEYNNWLSGIIKEQTQSVLGETDDVVALQPQTETAITTDVIGQVRVPSEIGPEPITSFAATATGEAINLDSSRRNLDGPGKSISFNSDTTIEEGTTFAIPSLKAVFNIAKSNKMTSVASVTLSYDEVTIDWLSNRILREKLQAATFDKDFVSDVEQGLVKIYSGSLTFKGLEVTLTYNGSQGDSFGVGNTLKDQITGLGFNVTSKSQSTTGGSITLKSEHPIVVALAQRILTSDDLGLVRRSKQLISGSNEIVAMGTVQKGNSIADLSVEILQPNPRKGTSVVWLLSKTRPGNDSQYYVFRGAEYQGAIDTKYYRQELDLKSVTGLDYEPDANYSLEPFLVGGGPSPGVQWMSPGVKTGSAYPEGGTFEGGVLGGPKSIPLNLVVSVDGEVVATDSRTLHLVTRGRVKNDRSYQFEGALGSAQGSVEPDNNLIYFPDYAYYLRVDPPPQAGSSF